MLEKKSLVQKRSEIKMSRVKMSKKQTFGFIMFQKYYCNFIGKISFENKQKNSFRKVSQSSFIYLLDIFTVDVLVGYRK